MVNIIQRISIGITDIIKIGLFVGYIFMDLSTIMFVLQQVIYVGIRLIL